MSSDRQRVVSAALQPAGNAETYDRDAVRRRVSYFGKMCVYIAERGDDNEVLNALKTLRDAPRLLSDLEVPGRA